jgi:hypothetical protein
MSNLSNRILLAAGLSWFSAVTLGLLFAACASGRFSFSTLRLPGVIPVALIISSIVAVLMLPIAFWSLRTGTKNTITFAPILWIVLAAYIVFVIPRTGPSGPYGLLVLSAIGLVLLGLLPAGR